MKKITKLMIIFFIFSLMQSIHAREIEKTPVGFWETIDDVTGQSKAIIQIWEAENTLHGKIYKIHPRPGVNPHELCTACKGVKHNKPILGMAIMENMQKSTETASLWNNGNILDPKNGKTYHCSMQLSESGQKLNVRGYIGLPLFGRSQTWYRVNNIKTTHNS